MTSLWNAPRWALVAGASRAIALGLSGAAVRTAGEALNASAGKVMD